MCSFDIPFTETATEFVAKIKASIESTGGTFNGDTTAGRLTVSTPFGKIAGSYTINGQNAAIQITQKPLLLICKTIEDCIKKPL